MIRGAKRRKGEKKKKKFGKGLKDPKSSSRAQKGSSLFLLGLEIKRKEGSIRNLFLFKYFKLGRYILASFESGVHETYWIAFYYLNAMFWICWHDSYCLNILSLHFIFIWNLSNMVVRLWFFVCCLMHISWFLSFVWFLLKV